MVMSSILRYQVEADRNENLVLHSDEDRWASVRCASKPFLKKLYIGCLCITKGYVEMALPASRSAGKLVMSSTGMMVTDGMPTGSEFSGPL